MRLCARDALSRRGLRGAARLLLDFLASLPRAWVADLKGRSVIRLLTSGVARDIGYAFRLLWRSPGFAAAAILTLALGIGANTAVFSLADATLIRPVRVERPEALVAFKWAASLPDYREWAARTDLFDGAAAAGGF